LWLAAEWLASLFRRHVGLGSESKSEVEKILEKPDLDSVIKYIKSDRCKNIITLAGAGISTCKFFLSTAFQLGKLTPCRGLY